VVVSSLNGKFKYYSSSGRLEQLTNNENCINEINIKIINIIQKNLILLVMDDLLICYLVLI
jgi:hypothetical protein